MSDRSTAPGSAAKGRAPFVLVACAGVAGGGELALRGAELWRGGGGAYALLWALMVLLFAVPVLLLDLLRVGEGQSGAVERSRVPPVILAVGLLILVGRLARLGFAMGEADGGWNGALVALAVAGLAASAALRAGVSLALAALVVGVAALAPVLLWSGLLGQEDGVALALAAFVPRPGALLHLEPWTSAGAAALASVPLIGASSAFLSWRRERSEPARDLVAAASLSALLLLLGMAGAVGTVLAAAPGASWPASTGADANLIAAAAGRMALAPLLSALAGTLGPGLVLGMLVRERAGPDRAPGSLALTLGGAGLLAGGLVLAGPPGLLAAELLSGWAGGVGLPLVALLISYELSRGGRLESRCRAVDPRGLLRLHRWLPWLARTAVPALALLVGLGSLGRGLTRPPGAEAAEALGSLGPLTGAVHVVTPALALVLGVTLCTGLAWSGSPRERVRP